MIACGTDLQFEKLIQILQADKILNNIEEFNNNKKRVLNREKLNNLLNEKLCEWEINDLIKKLIEFKIPGAPINDIKTVFESDQVKALNMVENVSSSKYNDLKLIRCPLSFSNNTLNKIQEPPAINEHYNYVLKSILSYDDQKIDLLIDNKIVLKND